MKNQYFGDRNDYFKYDLLILMAERLATKRLSIVWMRTENDRSNDGGKIKYSRGTGERGLYGFLQRVLEEGDQARDVRKLGEYFQGTSHNFEYCHYGSERLFVHSERTAYFDGIPKETLDNAVVFLDPDNGLEVKSTGDGNGDRYVTYNDVASIYGRMGKAAILVIYQHLPRLHRRLFLYGTFNRLVERLKGPMPVSISDNQIAFIILAKDKKQQAKVREALRNYTRSHLTIYD
jgi:hypothetical protein